MKKLLAVFIGLQILDTATTLIAFSLGGNENNPIVAHFLTVGPVAGLFISKLLVTGIAILGAQMQLRKGLRLANIAFIGVVAWNFTVIARLVMASGFPNLRA